MALPVEISHHLAIRRGEGVFGTETQIVIDGPLRDRESLKDFHASVLLITIVARIPQGGSGRLGLCKSGAHGLCERRKPAWGACRHHLAFEMRAEAIRILFDPVQQGCCGLVGIGTRRLTRPEPSPKQSFDKHTEPTTGVVEFFGFFVTPSDEEFVHGHGSRSIPLRDQGVYLRDDRFQTRDEGPSGVVVDEPTRS
jgi:hypothetical protein